MDKKKILICLCMVELIVFAVMTMFIYRQMKADTTIDTSIEDFKSGYIEYNDGWYANEDTVQMEEVPLNIVNGPDIYLPKGTYSIRIEYECDSDQGCVAYTYSGEDCFINAGTGMLSKNMTETVYKIEVTKDIERFLVAVLYNGKGSIGVRNISISRNLNDIKRVCFSLFLLFTVLNLCIYFSNQIKTNRKLIMMLGGIFVLSSMPAFVKGLGEGHHDLGFHLLRIEALAEEIRRSGEFPVRIGSLWFDGYGYPSSVYYGDLLLYIPAVLRMTGFSVMGAYKAYICLINAGTTVISCLCFKRIFRDKNIALLTCLAYMTAGYRVVNIWVRAAVGEYSAMMFFPIIAMAVYQIYMDDSSEWKVYKRNALFLAIGMTGLIGSHVLSTEIVTFTLGLLFIILWKRSFKKRVLGVYTISVVEALLLNLYFIIPFIDYYKNVKVKITNNISVGRIPRIQDRGAYITQYFDFFSDPYGINSIDVGDRLSLTPGLVLMAVLVLAGILLVNKKGNKEIKLFALISAMMLFIASNLFPWDRFAECKLGLLLAQVEFPWRYIGLAVIFLTLLMGSVMKLLFDEKNKYADKIFKYMVAGCIVMSCYFWSSYCEYGGVYYVYDTSELNGCHGEGIIDYLRENVEVAELTGRVFSENMKEVVVGSRNGHDMELYCEGTEEEGMIEVPIFNYKGYHVYDEYGTEYTISDGENDVIKFSLAPGFAGNIKVEFREPWYWRLSEIVSLLTVIVLFAGMKNFRKEKKRVIWEEIR